MEARDQEPFVKAMSGAINAAKVQAASEVLTKVLNVAIGFTFATFFMPLVLVYAWNGLTPNGWVEWEYLPTVAALFFFRIMIHWARTEGR